MLNIVNRSRFGMNFWSYPIIPIFQYVFNFN